MVNTGFPYRKVNIFLIGSKKKNKDFWKELGQDKHRSCKSKHQFQYGADSLFDPPGCWAP